MSYLTYRVEITRDESRASVPPSVEITAYVDRVPETNDAGLGRLTRASRGVWNSRLQPSGDFESLADALAAVAAAHPEVARIRCAEWSVDSEYPLEMAPLERAGGKWSPGKHPGGPPPQLDWQADCISPTP